MENGGPLIFLPWTKYIFPEWSGYKPLRRVMDENRIMFEAAIAEHKRNFKDGVQNDFIDVYLAEMKKHENDPNSQFYGYIAERNLASILFDLFFAGSDTTAMTTAWALGMSLSQQVCLLFRRNSRKNWISDWRKEPTSYSRL